MLRASKAPSLDERGDLPRDSRSTGEGLDLNELARSALRGDEFALRTFIRAVAPLVSRICRGVMGRENPDLEDSIQECLIEVADALPQFRFEADVSHYVAKIAMRRAIAARKRARTQSRHCAPLEGQSLPVAGFEAAVEARADLLRNVLDDLNEAQATALLLRLLLGHSIDEIAAITGVSANTVKTRLRLGKVQLGRWLKRNGMGNRAG